MFGLLASPKAYIICWVSFRPNIGVVGGFVVGVSIASEENNNIVDIKKIWLVIQHPVICGWSILVVPEPQHLAVTEPGLVSPII